MPWNSGMAAYCTPIYGLGLTVLRIGSALLIESSVTLAKGAAFWYAGLSYRDFRVPGGTLAQPSFDATRARYSLLVAHATNFSAASTFLELAGTASDQAQSQLEFFPNPAFGATAKPTLSATLDSFGFVMNDAATVASIQMAHLPELNSARFSLKPLVLAPGGPAAFMSST